MYKGIPYSNKIIKRRQQERLLNIHKQNLRSMRPLTNLDPVDDLTTNLIINNKKKDMIQQHRFTEIQRQNRMLLQKINSIMNKKSTFKQQKLKRNESLNADKQRMNKSLNQGFRKKQLQGIQIQNAKLLKRLQQKKSDYEASKLKEQWKKQKKVIKNLANYPFIIRDKIYKGRRKSMTSQSFHQGNGFVHSSLPSNPLSSPIQLVRIRNLSNHNFLITINFDGQKLQILGDNKTTKQIKIIQIPKQQAVEFIHFQCDDKIEGLFDCLRYDHEQRILFLVGKDVDVAVGQTNQENQEDHEQPNQNKKIKEISNKNNQEQSAHNNQQEQTLKKKEMSNIYQVDQSQMNTEYNKLSQTNQNFLNNTSNPLNSQQRINSQQNIKKPQIKEKILKQESSKLQSSNKDKNKQIPQINIQPQPPNTIKHGEHEFAVLYDKAFLQKTVKQMAAVINAHYKQLLKTQQEPAVFVVCVLKGAFMFFTDLVKHLDFKIQQDFIRLSSYKGGMVSTNQVKFLTEVNYDKYTGRHLLIVQDIIDTGKTLFQLTKKINNFQPKSIQIAALIRRHDKKQAIQCKFLGLDSSDFIVGYGMDLDEHLRCLPQIYQKV